MADRPIIFSGPMVRALLEGRKTQTRRLATSPLRRCAPGDRLYVRETFHPWKGSASGRTIVYVADGEWIDWGSGWRGKPEAQFLTPSTPSIHMPRWASRLTLTVRAVKQHHLQEITADEAEAEGVFRHVAPHSIDKVFRSDRGPTAIRYFRELWDSLHPDQPWTTNPLVVAIEFDVARGNIDARLAA